MKRGFISTIVKCLKLNERPAGKEVRMNERKVAWPSPALIVQGAAILGCTVEELQKAFAKTCGKPPWMKRPKGRRKKANK